MRIATVGSRNISLKTSQFLVEVGKMLVEHGHFIQSGCADGSDSCFMRGASSVNPRHVIVYLPWRDYNPQYIVEGNRVTWDILPEWEEVAKRNHPKWDTLKDSVKNLMSRNAGIVSRADKMIAYIDPSSRYGGGTAHAIRCFKERDLPILILSEKDCTLEEIKDFVEK